MCAFPVCFLVNSDFTFTFQKEAEEKNYHSETMWFYFPFKCPTYFWELTKLHCESFIFRQHVFTSHWCHYWKPRSTHGSASCFPSYRAPFLSSALSRTHPLLQAAGLPPPAQSVCPCLWASIIKPHKGLFPSQCISLLRLLIFFPPECVSCVQLVSLYIHLPLLSSFAHVEMWASPTSLKAATH